MGQTSSIQWTDATWNIARGCTKVDEDCKFCYMYRDSFNSTRYNPLNVVKTKTVFGLPLRITKPSKIFTSSLTDFFHPDIDSYREEAWDIIRRCPEHTFQILTKRPERIIEQTPAYMLQWDNIWFGTSVGSPKGMQRIYDLIEIDCKTRFVSFEPLWEHIDMNLDISTLLRIDWAIIGGESGNETGKYRYRPCEIEWIEEIAHAVKSVGNYVFVKQLGTFLSKQLHMSDRHGGNIDEFPEHLRIREFPKPHHEHTQQ